MTHLRNALLSLFLALCCLLAGQAVYSLNRLDEATAAATSALQQAERRIAHTSQNANAVLVQLSLAADQWRRASERQEVYGRKLEAALNESTALIADSRKAVQTLERQVEANGEASQKAIQKVTELGSSAAVSLGRVDGLVVQVQSALVPLPAIAANVAQGTAALATAADGTNDTVQEAKRAMTYVADSLKPTKQGFWSRVLFLILGVGPAADGKDGGKMKDCRHICPICGKKYIGCSKRQHHATNCQCQHCSAFPPA